MPGCCVKVCSNRSERGFRLFRIPSGKKNIERRQEWLQLIGRNTLPERAEICEVHFNENQFEKNRADGRKLLRPSAIPNLLLHAVENDKDTEIENNSKEKYMSPNDDEYEDNANHCSDNSSSNVNNSDNVVNDSEHSVTTNVKNVSNENEFDEKIRNYEEQITKFKKSLNKVVVERNALKKKLEKTNTRFNKIFNKDQREFIAHDTHREALWSSDTITKALKLYTACGQKGYEEVRRQNLPYPSIRTLQSRIQGLKFKPGILEDVFNMLKIKIQSFIPEEKHAALLIDEMSIKPGLQYDNSIMSVVGRPTMKLGGGLDSSDKIATHSLVFMLCGISTKWKQTVAYKFTGNSFCSEETCNKITSIIQKAHSNGLVIKVIISDMGPQNRSWWNIMKITVGKSCKLINHVEHPCNYQDKLFIMPDSVHVYKNVACSLTSGNTFHLNETIVKKYDLPSNKISITPIREVFNLDKNDTLKLCPYLKESTISPSHFDKMNAGLSVGLLNKNVASAILFHIANNNIASEHKTTAWFLNIMYKWFKLMTGRYQKLALSHSKVDVYKENINFLQDFMEIVRGITVGNGAWKPFQSGLLLCTQTALDVQAEYLEKYNFKFLLLGRFTQDALENLFSQIRSRTSVPDAREFKQTLRLICLSQYQANINRGSYSVTNSQDLVQYCDKIKQFDSKNISVEERSLQNNEDLWDVNIYQSLLGDESDLNNTVQAALYHLIGALLFKIKKNFLHCNHCFNVLIRNNDSNNNFVSYDSLSFYSKLREYKENILTFPSIDVYNFIYKCELLFRKNETNLLSNKLKVVDFIDKFLDEHSVSFIPSCHNIGYKLIKNFVITRIHFALKKTSSDIKKANNYSSKSVTMKMSVANKKCK